MGGLVSILRLAENMAVDDNDRIRSNYERSLRIPGHEVSLRPRKPLRMCCRILTRCVRLIHIRGADIVRNADQIQQVASAR